MSILTVGEYPSKPVKVSKWRDLTQMEIIENFEDNYQQILENIKSKIKEDFEEKDGFKKYYVQIITNIMNKYNGNIDNLSFEDALRYILQTGIYYHKNINMLYFFYKKDPEKFEQIALDLTTNVDFEIEITGKQKQFFLIKGNKEREFINLYKLQKDENIHFQNPQLQELMESGFIKSLISREDWGDHLHNIMRQIQTDFDVKTAIKLLNQIDFYRIFRNYIDSQKRKQKDIITKNAISRKGVAKKGKEKKLIKKGLLNKIDISGGEYIGKLVFFKYAIFNLNNQLIDKLNIPELQQLKNSPELLANGYFKIKGDSYDFRRYAEDYIFTGTIDEDKISTTDDYKKFVNQIAYFNWFKYPVIQLFVEKKDIEVFVHNLKAYNQFDDEHPAQAGINPDYLVKAILSVDENNEDLIEITKDRLLKGKRIFKGTERYIDTIIKDIQQKTKHNEHKNIFDPTYPETIIRTYKNIGIYNETLIKKHLLLMYEMPPHKFIYVSELLNDIDKYKIQLPEYLWGKILEGNFYTKISYDVIRQVSEIIKKYDEKTSERLLKFITLGLEKIHNVKDFLEFYIDITFTCPSSENELIYIYLDHIINEGQKTRLRDNEEYIYTDSKHLRQVGINALTDKLTLYYDVFEVYYYKIKPESMKQADIYKFLHHGYSNLPLDYLESNYR